MRTGKIGVYGNEGRFRSLETGEYVSKLTGSSGRAIYDQMRRGDGAVWAVLKSINLPLLRADWNVEPATDSAQDKQVAEFVSSNLLNRERVWREILSHILLMLPFGFSILEKCWLPIGGKIQLSDLAPRLPMSITSWELDERGNNLGPIQLDHLGNEIILPWNKIAVFTNDKEGANYEGISILRPCYKSWYLKDKLEIINAIKHDRHGVGVPTAEAGEMAADSEEDREKIKTALENVAASEQSWMVTPKGWKFSIQGGGTNAGTDALTSIKYYDEQIYRSAMAMFLYLGSSESGSRSLGETFNEQFLMSLESYADYICEVINRHVVKELVDYNYNVAEYPQLKAGGIRGLDIERIANLLGNGTLTKDADTENAIRRELSLPEIDPEDVKPVTAPGFSYDHDLALSEEETIPDLEGLEKYFDSAQESLTQKLLQIRDRQAAGIASQLGGGKSVVQLTVPYKKEMYETLVDGFEQAIKKGQAEAQAELKKQSRNMAMADPAPDELEETRREELRLVVDGAGDKLKTMMAQRYLELLQQGLSPREAQARVQEYAKTEVSENTWKEMAALATTKGVGLGRDQVFESNDDQISYYYYSSILDRKRCEVCKETEDNPDSKNHRRGDARFQTPNPGCLGGGKCRCLTIAVYKEESA